MIAGQERYRTGIAGQGELMQIRIQSLNTMVSPLGESMNSCDNISPLYQLQDIESHAHFPSYLRRQCCACGWGWNLQAMEVKVFIDGAIADSQVVTVEMEGGMEGGGTCADLIKQLRDQLPSGKGAWHLEEEWQGCSKHSPDYVHIDMYI